ncbi:MAG: CDF family Co(II)/Ni(II) efflux transporter DmeF [Planctomycetaceae bacterium]|nr:CDF family Co(II)/Ni(II) efflux transporter DmeF [Planctomycetaceae bacterium]
MHQDPTDPLHRGHDFLGAQHDRNERRLWLVIALTLATMVAEIVAGTVFGSMALLADGWHMATHAGALSIGALAYAWARRRVHDPRFVFGTGKVGDLAGYTSAVALAGVALLIAWESFTRFFEPISIRFDEAILVAVLGLVVNLASAWLLREDHAHSHDHGHDHHHSDHNLRAAYLHVLADALTSVVAIAALVLGRQFGWMWMDAVGGLLGALVILRWSYGLVRDTGGVLLDVERGGDLASAVRERIEQDGDLVLDQHVWRLGPGHFGAILVVESDDPLTPREYRARLVDLAVLAHVTVEVRTRENHRRVAAARG